MSADFQKLDVYKAAVEVAVTVDALLQRLPRGRAYLVDQLRRAVSSIGLNIAEGAGEFSAADKAKYYRYARRSAYECIAVLDLIEGLRIGDPTEMKASRTLLDRIGAMLTKMIVSLERTGSGQAHETTATYPDSDSPARTEWSAPVTSSGLTPASGSGAARLDSDSDSDSDLDAPELD